MSIYVFEIIDTCYLIKLMQKRLIYLRSEQKCNRATDMFMHEEIKEILDGVVEKAYRPYFLEDRLKNVRKVYVESYKAYDNSICSCCLARIIDKLRVVLDEMLLSKVCDE